MNTNKDLLQTKWELIQENLIENVISENEEVSMTINGHIQIKDLKIQENISSEELSRLLIIHLNTGIKNIALKVQKRFVEFQKTGF